MRDSLSIHAPKAHFVTMGCAKNEVDTSNMRAKLRRAGISCTDDIDDCDVVIVNTCSFIAQAVEESVDTILDITGDDRIRENGIPVIVAGCMPARYGDVLEDLISEAASFVPCSREDDIAEIVCSCLGLTEGETASLANLEDADPRDVAERLFAYIKISDGCDRFCSYCTIPYIRGRYRSFSPDDIISDVAKAIASGAREVVLIGQDTGLWGHDLEGSFDLAHLLDSLASNFENCLFRVMYTQPENVTDNLLDVMANKANIAPYLDIPFQHCSKTILSAMNRSGSADEFLRIIDKARKRVPDIAIRTTLMVGFPGETDADFDELVEFVEDAQLEYVGIFAYSREEGTASDSMDGHVDDDIKEMRLSTLRDVADSISNAVISLRRGQVFPMLIEGVEEDGQLFGRIPIQAPEVDGVTFIDAGEIGDMEDVVIEDTLFYDMEAVRL